MSYRGCVTSVTLRLYKNEIARRLRRWHDATTEARVLRSIRGVFKPETTDPGYLSTSSQDSRTAEAALCESDFVHPLSFSVIFSTKAPWHPMTSVRWTANAS